MRFQVIFHSLGYLTQAAGVTIALSLAGIALGFVLGAAACMARFSGRPWLAKTGAAYISIFRGVPLLVQLLFIYYFLAKFGLDIPALAAAIGGLGCASGAYQAEILRGLIRAERPDANWHDRENLDELLHAVADGSSGEAQRAATF